MDKIVNNEHPIDVVIPWVDGNDPLHQDKMKLFLSGKHKFNDKSFRTRFDQVEEIEYAIKSILKYAIFVRKIFLVTDNQIPDFLKNIKFNKEFEKVVIVDHKEIFIGFEKYLPTFNCLPIETMITNIPDLSENFIYFNDDVFLIKETKPEMFFKNGMPILRGKWKTFDERIWYKVIKKIFFKLLGNRKKENSYGYKKGQQNIARKLKFKKYFKFDHTPAPLRKSTIDNYFSKNPDMKLLNARHRFRHKDQFTLQGLANHIEIKNKTCILKNDYQLGYIQSYKKPLMWYKIYFWYCSLNTNKLFLCLQSLDQCPQDKLDFFKKWLNKKNE